MADIAELGFKIDTGDVSKAVSKLNELTKAASGVSAGADKVAAATQGSALASKNAALAVARAEASKATAILKTLRATEGAAAADIKAAIASKKKADAGFHAAKSARDAVAATNAVTAANQRMTITSGEAAAAFLRESAAIKQVSAGLAARAKIPANDQMPNRFNTANIAAQFQDIGVTSAMGMNPLTIALQQGTQLSAILNTMESPLKGIVIALKSIMNVVSLTSIALVALVAAGLQLVDWVEVGRSALYGLANVIEDVAAGVVALLPLILAVGTAFTLWSLPTIISGVTALTTTVYGLSSALAVLMVTNPFGLIVLGIAAAVTAFYVFKDETEQILGFDLIASVKKGVNFMIGAFVGGYEMVSAQWSRLPSLLGYLVIEAASNVKQGLADMINSAGALMDMLPGPDMNLNIQTKRFPNEFANAMGEAGKTIQETMNKALYETDYVGQLGEKVAEGARSGIQKIRDLAKGLGSEDDKKKKKKGGKTDVEHYADIVSGANRRIASLNAEQDGLLLTEAAAAKMKYTQDLLNQATQKGIELTPQQVTELGNLAGQMANIEAETKRTEAAMGFLKESGKDFISSFKADMAAGEGVIKSFGNAVLGVFEKIANKLIDSGIDQIFEGFQDSSSSGGILSSVAGFLGFADGGSFDGASVNKFAKGGAFTNSIVSKPTLFQFANGGKFGEMGEAGPEAIMPLSRGSDGSLGVRAVGGASENNVYVNVQNNGNSTVGVNQRETSNGIEIDVMIDESVGEKIGDQSSLTNRSLQSFNNRTLRKR